MCLSLVEDAGEAIASGGEATLGLAAELDLGGVVVLANAAHVVVDTNATLVHLLRVNTILGVEVLDLTRGEHAVDAAVELELDAGSTRHKNALE